MCFCVFFLAAALSASSADVPRVRHVEVSGNLHVPTAGILRRISVVPGIPFDPAASQADLRKLYGLGVFQSVQVDSRNAGPGWVDVTYRVQEFPYVSAFLIEGVTEGLEGQILDFLRKEKLDIHPGSPFNPSAGNKAALAVRDFLRTRKYPNAEVEVVPRVNGNLASVTLDVQQGVHMEVGRVHFTGNRSIAEDELRKQMKRTRAAPFWARWAGAGRYIPEELAADLQQVRLYYQSHGFANAVMGEPEVQASDLKGGFHLPLPGFYDENPKVVVTVPIVEGPRFTLASISLEGDAKVAAPEVGEITKSIRTPSEYDLSLLQNKRQKILDALGHHGYALARVDLDQAIDPEDRTVRATLRIHAGDPVLIGRIEFEGNKRLPDRFLRRELAANEGEVYDSQKLDKSILRLNKSNIIKEVQRSDVSLRMDEERNLLDITFHVKEKDRQGLYGTGGTGGIGGGYLGLIYTAFNLLRLGETLSFELDGGAAQSNILLDIVGTHFLGTPFTIGLSAFDRLTDFNIANIVPGPDNLVQLLRRRTAGVGLSGAYPITTKLAAGAGFLVERDSISVDSPTGPAVPAGAVNRSDFSPFLVYDSTRGSGASTRGYRLALSHGFSGTSFLRSLDSTSNSFRYAQYLNDPLTYGRNSFALMFQASGVRPHSGSPLFLDRRLYPGDESVRGFQRGGLSPWVYVPGDTSVPLQPSGADTMIGLSAEYRVPIQGALSGIVFMDLGWSRISPLEASQVSSGAVLLEKTSGLLRASVGGELRLQLPMIHQPARLIFAWNPLRLGEIFVNSSSSSPLRLADPRGTIRFALGNLF